MMKRDVRRYKRNRRVLWLLIAGIIVILGIILYLFIDAVFLQPTVTPENLVPFTIKDTIGGSGDRWVRFGINLPKGEGIYNPDNIEILSLNPTTNQYSKVDADIQVLNRRGAVASDGSKEIWWFLVVFRADAMAANEARTYYVNYGLGVQNSVQSPMTLADSGTYYTVTGNQRIFEVNKNKFDIFRRVSVNGVDIISPSSSSGFYAKGADGIDYSTVNDVPEVTLIEDGKVHKTFRVKGKFRSVAAVRLLDYDAYLHIYRDGKAELNFLTENRGPIDNNVNGAHARFDYLEGVLDLNLQTSQPTYALTEFYPPGTLQAGTELTAYQDFNPAARETDALIVGTDPTNLNIFDNFYLRIADQNGNSPYFQQNEPESQSGTRSDGPVALSDGTVSAYAAIEDFYQRSPKTLTVEGDRIHLGLFGKDHSTQNYLVHDQGKILRTKTDPIDPTKYGSSTFMGEGSGLQTVLDAQHAVIDEGVYVLHSSTGEYNKMSFDFSNQIISTPGVQAFAKNSQEQLIGLATPSYYRTSLSFPDRFSFLEERDWNNEPELFPLFRRTGTQWTRWSRSMWDENYVTADYSGVGWAYPKPTLWGRTKMGNEGGGTKGNSQFWGQYFGEQPWQLAGAGHASYNTGKGIMGAILHSGDHRGLQLLRGILLAEGIESVYRWSSVSNPVAGARKHEAGNEVYGFYPFGPPFPNINSQRHQQEEGIPIYALVSGNRHVWDGLLLSSVDIAGGYPWVAQGTAGPTVGRIQLNPSSSNEDIGHKGIQIKNLIGYYLLTGDDEYIKTAKKYITTVRNIFQACENLYGVKIAPRPSQDQTILPTTPVANIVCTPTTQSSAQTQSFLNFYFFESVFTALNAEYEATGVYDTDTRDFFLSVIEDYFTYVVQPYLPAADPPLGTTPYTPIRVPNNIFIYADSSPPTNCTLNAFCSGNPSCGVVTSSSIIITELPNTNYNLLTCQKSIADSEGLANILAQYYYFTGNTVYRDYAGRILRDLLLYSTPNAQPIQFGNEAQMVITAWQHLGMGYATVKLASNYVVKPAVTLNILLNLVPPLTFPTPPDCGNGNIITSEQCDDGDLQNGDGCSSLCQLEQGWSCSGQPSVCVQVLTLFGVTPSTVFNNQATTLTISGSGFTPNSQVYIGGVFFSSTFVSANQLTVPIPSFCSLGACVAGMYGVVVVDGSVTSNTINVQVTSPTPVLTSVTPSIFSNDVATDTTIVGSNFMQQTVTFAGSALEVSYNGGAFGAVLQETGLVSFIDSQTLIAHWPAMLPSGPYAIRITNPGPGGTTPAPSSAPVSLTIQNACSAGSTLPVLTSITPTSIYNDVANQFTLIGQNFQPGVSISIGGSIQIPPTTYVSSTQLLVDVAANILAPADYSISIVNPDGCTSTDQITISVLAPTIDPPTTGTTGTTGSSSGGGSGGGGGGGGGTVTVQCNNNLDDDGDGLKDYPADPGCVSRADNSEQNAPLISNTSVGGNQTVSTTGGTTGGTSGGTTAESTEAGGSLRVVFWAVLVVLSAGIIALIILITRTIRRHRRFSVLASQAKPLPLSSSRPTSFHHL